MNKVLILSELKKYLGYKKDGDFADFLGIKQNTLSSWKSRNTIDYDLIISKCENINANWLLTGKGSMLKEQEGQTANTSSEVALLKEQISLLKENKALINKECQRLQCEIKQLQERVALLEQENKTLKSV